MPSLERLAEDKYLEKFNQLQAQGFDERDAQKQAIKDAFRELVIQDSENASAIWSAIYAAHLKRKSGLTYDLTEDQIDKVISADQSWKKTSGHAAEAFFAESATKYLRNEQIIFFLQTEVTKILNDQESTRVRRRSSGSQRLITNPPTDLVDIHAWLGSSAFDLYAAYIEPSTGDGIERLRIFGCIQSKTSIRDRVTRDREPSIIAMSKFFWSIALVINGDFLKLDKFAGMVNGGTSDYVGNGWHGMYAMHLDSQNNRIYKLKADFSPLVEHAKQAKDKFINERQWFGSNWLPRISD